MASPPLEYMKTDNKIKIVGVVALITKDRKLLCVKRKGDIWEGMLSLPGGRLEQGEAEIEGLIREVEEETGYLIEPTGDKPAIISEIVYQDQPAIYKVYECVIKRGKEYAQKEEVEKIVWLDAKTYLDSIKLHDFNKKAVEQLEIYLKKRALLK